MADGLRIAIVTPWFADTAILPSAFKTFMAGIPMVPVQKVAGAVFLAATDGEQGSNGAVYSLPDEKEVFRILPPRINEGVYRMLDERVKRAASSVQTIVSFFAFLGIIARSTTFRVFSIALLSYTGYKFAVERGLL